MSAFRQKSSTPAHSHSKPALVDMKLQVPSTVTDMANSFFNRIWDSLCPFAPLFVWIQVLMSCYYLFLMPDMSVHLDQDKVRASKVSRTLRGWLFIVSVACGVFGYMIISQGCKQAGSQWSVLWFLAAVILTWFVTRLMLASIEQTTLTNASDILKQLN